MALLSHAASCATIDLLSLMIARQSNGNTDETIIRFVDGATNGFDAGFDAAKFYGGFQVPGIASVIGDTMELAINSLSATIEDQISVEIRPQIYSSDTCWIYLKDSMNMENRPCIFLEDKATGIITDMRHGNRYQFYLNSNTDTARFILHISGVVHNNSMNASCFNSTDGMVASQLPDTGDWNLNWYDENLQLIDSHLVAENWDSLQFLAAGMYFVIGERANGSCISYLDSITIVEPAEYILNAAVTDVDCFGNNNGQIVITPSGVGPWTYTWFDNNGSVIHTTTNSAFSDLLVNLGELNVNVIVADSSIVCNVDSIQVSVDEPMELGITLTTEHVSCYYASDGSINAAVIGGSSFYQYNWSNGESSALIDTLDGGFYGVTITDLNGCLISGSATINEPNEVIAEFEVSVDTLYISQGGFLSYTCSSTTNLAYSWDFGDGGLSDDYFPSHQYVDTGMYYISLQVEEDSCYAFAFDSVYVMDFPLRMTEKQSKSVVDWRKCNGALFFSTNTTNIDQYLMIFNLNGSLIINTALADATSSCSIEHLALGCYTAVLVNSAGSSIFRFVK